MRTNKRIVAEHVLQVFIAATILSTLAFCCSAHVRSARSPSSWSNGRSYSPSRLQARTEQHNRDTARDVRPGRMP